MVYGHSYMWLVNQLKLSLNTSWFVIYHAKGTKMIFIFILVLGYICIDN